MMNPWRAGMIAAAAILAAEAPAMAQGVSAGVGRPLQAAVRLANSGNTAAAIAQVNTARSAATTANERRKVGEAAAFVYTKAGQWLAAARELENIGAGPRQLAPYYYRAGNFDKAMELAKRGGGEQMDVIMAQAYLKKGDAKGAAEVYQRLIKQNGPRTEWLENLASAQFKMKDRAGYLQTVRQLIRSDPRPERWNTLLAGLKRQNMGDGPKLALYQLIRQTGNLTTPEDVQDMAKFSVLGGLPGAAVMALNEAAQANVISATDPMVVRLVQVAQTRAVQNEAAARRLPNNAAGQYAVANVLFGKGAYPQAANAYGKAVAGGANVDQARVLQGIALIRAGDAGGGLRALNAIPDASAYNDVAELWALYAQTRTG